MSGPRLRRRARDPDHQMRPQDIFAEASTSLVAILPGMSVRPTRYRSVDEDSLRWLGFPFRRGDIVISTRSKSGTTWVQMICALLIFQRADLPDSLVQLSPWL